MNAEQQFRQEVSDAINRALQDGVSPAMVSGILNGTTSRAADEAAKKLIDERQFGKPIWIRPPKRGVDFYCGLSRAKLYQLAGEGKIVTRTLREPGQIKGTRLFLLESILKFIENCSDGVNV